MCTKTPKLTIITVNYNNINGLKKTVESVINQTWKAFEFVVIDGGSIDGSMPYIKSQKHHFDYWSSEPDTGIYNAMNKGIKVAKGEYLFFLNSGDDFINSQSLETIFYCLTGEDVVYFNINRINEDAIYLKKLPETLTFKFLHEDLPPHQSTFIKKALFETVGGYDENLKIVSDWKFLILALCKFNASYKHVDDVFTNFYEGGISSSTHSYTLIKEERSKVLEQEFSVFMQDLKYQYKLERLLRTLRKSRYIKLLVKLGLIHKF